MWIKWGLSVDNFLMNKGNRSLITKAMEALSMIREIERKNGLDLREVKFKVGDIIVEAQKIIFDTGHAFDIDTPHKNNNNAED